MRRRMKAVAPNEAVIYLRVSTREQGETGVGLEAQAASCRAHASRLGLPVVSVHTDVQTGKDAVADRPGLQAAIAAVQDAPGRVLVAYSVSRVARRQKVLWGLLDDRDGLGIPLSSATEPFDTATPMGRAMLGMLAVWSTLEADMIAARTRDAMATLAAKGVKFGAPAMTHSYGPGGYGPSPAKVETIRAVQALQADLRLPLRALAKELEARGIASVTGARWHPRTLRIALATHV